MGWFVITSFIVISLCFVVVVVECTERRACARTQTRLDHLRRLLKERTDQ